MAYFNDKLILISDSLDNIDLFRLSKARIIRRHFNRWTKTSREFTIAKDVFLEYDISIDREDTIYTIYQNTSMDLVLTLLRGKRTENIKLTKEPIPEIYYLNMELDDNKPHIFYLILLSSVEKKYRIYHHYFDGNDWIINVVDEIKVRELLNPIKVFIEDKKLILAYYDNVEDEQIYIKAFNLNEGKWGEKIRLTEGKKYRLYIDLIIKDDKLHISYCKYEGGNLVVIYERFKYVEGSIEREVEMELSNPENPQYPTLIYYDNKLWVSWIEYDNVMSRYSTDEGNTWSPIYLWKESKKGDIVRYKYDRAMKGSNILNYSFGKIYPEISFIGFGPIHNTREIPLKKKIWWPRINIII